MNNAWIEAEANAFITTHGPERGAEIAHLAYATRLVGCQPDLAMHGGGNTSLKGMVKTVPGDDVAALFVKASGVAMDKITPADFICLDLAYLRKLRALPSLTDEIMANEFRLHMLTPSDRLPSIETLMHAFIDAAVVVHTHPTAILTLTNRTDAQAAIAEALGDAVEVVPYLGSGPALGRAVADVFDRGIECRAIVAMQHGLITWGASPKQAYDRTIELVGRAEEYIRKNRRSVAFMNTVPDAETARARYRKIAPLLRGLLSPPSADPDKPHKKMILAPLHIRGDA